MGSGIAILFLRAGYKVILVDNNAKGLKRGSKIISNVFKQDVAKSASLRIRQNLLSAVISKLLSTWLMVISVTTHLWSRTFLKT